MEKIKIAMVASNLELNGISAVIMNYCRNLNLNKFEITLFVGNYINENYKKELQERNINIIELPWRKKSKLKYYRSLMKLMKKDYFDICHVHGNSSVMAIDLAIAYMKNIKVRIAHSHNTKCSNLKLHKLLSPIFNRLYTNAFACSKKAGEWIFKDNNFEIINNGIDIEKYVFNKDVRERVRKELDLKDNEFVLGHVGRINYQKNQEYLLKIFEKYCEKDVNAKLLLIGKGPLYDEVKEKIEKSPIQNKVILYGESSEAQKFYMAMDVFVFPSRYEGLPVTLVEAQIAGIPCIISQNITDEVIVTQSVIKESIDVPCEMWSQHIENIKKIKNNRKIIINEEINKFNIKDNVKRLENLYEYYFKGDKDANL